jgi:hypothetical protein
VKDMTTQSVITNHDEEKALRNAEYLAKIDHSMRQAESGEVVKMSFEEWEDKFDR